MKDKVLKELGSIGLLLPVNQETSEKSAEISKSWLQVWTPPTKIFKTAKIT